MPNQDCAGLVVLDDLGIAGLVIPDGPRRYATPGSRARFVFLAADTGMMTWQEPPDVTQRSSVRRQADCDESICPEARLP